VPWCTPCDRFLSPSTVRVDGTCPSCGQLVDPGRAHHAEHAPQPATPAVPDHTADADDTPEPLPWHLKLLLVALAIYLSYRALQGVEWLVAHL